MSNVGVESRKTKEVVKCHEIITGWRKSALRFLGSMSIVGVGPVRLKSVVTFSQGGVIYPAFFLFLKG
jgi:hypothetical protein